MTKMCTTSGVPPQQWICLGPDLLLLMTASRPAIPRYRSLFHHLCRENQQLCDGGNYWCCYMIQVASGDMRHTLLTLSRLSRLPLHTGNIELVIYEDVPEVLSRHMLLVAMALDFTVPTRTRMERLLEVHGNCLLQERTALYVGEVL
jgi:Domain of unknown function (DUF4470)